MEKYLKKIGILENLDIKKWCRWPDSNWHGKSHCPLKTACLPIPPHRHCKILITKGQPQGVAPTIYGTSGTSLSTAGTSLVLFVVSAPGTSESITISCGAESIRLLGFSSILCIEK